MRIKNVEMWDFPDRYEKRLDLEKLLSRLKQESPSEVYTHGILGEYGHPHHQDVCLAAHRAYPKGIPVWSVAYNCFAEKVFRIPRPVYNRKCEILANTYLSETQRFARFLPSYNHEGYSRISIEEVETVYEFLLGGPLPKPEKLKNYGWFIPYLEEFRRQIYERPF